MSLSQDQIKKIALLARLNLTLEEEQRYADQLSVILDYVEQLKSLPPTNQEMVITVSHSAEELRRDESDGGRHQQEIVAGAPQRQDNFFAVPAVFGGGE